MNPPTETAVLEPFCLNAGFLPSGEPLYLRGEVRISGSPVEVPNAEKKPVLLLVHGFKGFKDWGFFPYTADCFAQKGYYTVTFNFSCNGVAETDFDELDKFAWNTYSREQDDLLLLLQAVQGNQLPLAEHADPAQIYLLGHSRGGGSSILFAADHEHAVKAVATWNGIAKADLFDEMFKEQVIKQGAAYVANARTGQDMPIGAVFYEDLEEQGDRFDIVARLSRLSVPVLQVQGDQDSARLQEGFKALRKGAPQHPVKTIGGGTHTFGAVHPFAGTTPQLEEAIEATLQFFQQH